MGNSFISFYKTFVNKCYTLNNISYALAVLLLSMVDIIITLTKLTPKPSHGPPTINNLNVIKNLIKKGLVGLIILNGLFACNNTKPSIVTYDLEPRDLVEKIYVTGTLESANNFVIIAPTVSSSNVTVADVADEGTYVKMGDTVCILAAPDIQGYFDKYSEDLDAVKAGLVKQEADNALNISVLQAQVEKNKVKMAFTQLDSIQIKFAPPVKQKIMKLELEKANVEEKKLIKKLEAQETINEQTIRQLKSRVIQSEQLVARFQDQLDMLTITASKDGMVVHSESPYVMVFSSGGGSGSFGGKLKKGATVRRRMPLIDLPDLTDMQVQLQVQEGNYKRIEKGQKVVIRPEAVDGLITTGVVKSKALTGKILDRNSKIKSYEITISIDSCDTQMLPGLSANCEIVINQVQDTVVVPTMAIYKRDSSKIVYVQKGEVFTPIVIETGLSNSTETIITSGLTGHETIALIEPPMNFIEKQKNKTDE